MSNCPIPDLVMTSYDDDFTLLASTTSIVEAEPKSHSSDEMGKWETSSHYSPEIQRDSIYYRYPPCSPAFTHNCESATRWLHLNRTHKILGVMLDTHFTFDSQVSDYIERASRALNIMKASVHPLPPTSGPN